MLRIFYVFCVLPVQGESIAFSFHREDLKAEQLFSVTQRWTAPPGEGSSIFCLPNGGDQAARQGLPGSLSEGESSTERVCRRRGQGAEWGGGDLGPPPAPSPGPLPGPGPQRGSLGKAERVPLQVCLQVPRCGPRGGVASVK